jgi:hypothetical protein
MNIFPLLLQIIALICLGCAAFGVSVSKVSLGWFGMTLWLLSLMVSGIVLHPVQ